MTAVVESSSDYGTVYSPKFTDEGLAGCVFEVKDAAGKTIATLTTDKNGYAETGLLEFGTYTVQEVSSVEGYTKDDTVHSITLAYKDQNTPIVKATVSVKNDRIPASVKVKKMTERWNMDEFAFEPCVGEGFVFGLYTAESIGILPKDALVEVLTTDTEGIAASANLPIGYYYLRELQVPDETIYLSQNTFPLSVSGVNTVYFDEPVVNEMFKGNIAVWKSDKADADRMLSGAVFEIRGEDDVLYDTITTDKDGYAISIDLPVGTYHVQEIDPPTGFILSDEVTEIIISTDNKNTVVFESSNEANKMTLKKSDIVSSEPVSNATVTIYDASGAVFFEGKTDENGEIHLSEVPAGKYTYKETIAPDGYAINTETFSFEMDDYGKVTGTTEITDEPIVLKLTKMDTFTGKPFAGIEFVLKDAEGNAVKTAITDDGYRVVSEDGEESFKVDENGYAEFRYLKAGEYTIVENTPIGYISEDAFSVKLTDAHSLSAPYALTVENCPTGLKISKVDTANNKPLMGAGFRIKVRDGLGFETLTFTKQQDGSFFYDPNGTVMDMMVDGNGEIMIYGLPLGDIWIEESIVPEGYFPNAAARVEITKKNKSTDPYKITIKNSKYVKLGMDSDWWEFPALMLGIPKKSDPNKKRPLGIPSANDKLVQEVVRLILESIYEPNFSEQSHGFRPRRSCHTALLHLQRTFTGAKWFVEGDIKACFDSFDHHVLIDILRLRIADEAFIALMWKFLKAGYMEQWEYHKTYSGTPQGSDISPILANIYLNELDRHIADYKASFDQGSSLKRKANPEYERMRGAIERAKRRNAKIWDELNEAERKHRAAALRNMKAELRTLPRSDPFDINYKSLQYIRYADDFIIGVICQSTCVLKAKICISKSWSP